MTATLAALATRAAHYECALTVTLRCGPFEGTGPNLEAAEVALRDRIDRCLGEQGVDTGHGGGNDAESARRGWATRRARETKRP
jgi:hypothetical protein